jgi:DNA-3-methyladenine glycosylase II
MDASVREWTVPVRPPYRLDLTATVLRRLSTNVVDVFDEHVYRRLVGAGASPALLEVQQRASDALCVRVTGDPGADVPSLIARMLGTEVDLTDFYAAAADFPWLERLVHSARGVKPPRYPSLWEAIVNAVVFQQVSIHAAAAILRRVIERYEQRRRVGGTDLAAFVPPQVIVDADALELRGLGLSVNKIVALRTLGRAVLDGELDAGALDGVETAELVVRLAAFKGIGPWTAAVIALRGFGRLDIFPLNDSGVARSLKDLSGDPDIDAGAILERLAAQRGMLYYHLLLGRLAARGDIVF